MKLSKSEDEQRISLYKKGFSDEQIASIIGISRKGVSSWRTRRNLPSNMKRLYLDTFEDKKREALYQKGLSDRVIAEMSGSSRTAIRWWRKRRGKTPNFIRHQVNPRLEMSATLAYILGAVHGDGCFVKNKGSGYRFKLEVKAKAFASSFMQALKMIGLNPFMSRNNSCWSVITSSKAFHTTFSHPNFLSLYHKLIENKDFAWHFLRGAYEAEGSVVLREKACSVRVTIFSNQNPDFFELVRKLCDFCDIPYGKICERPQKNGILKILRFKGSTSKALSFLEKLNPSIKNVCYAQELLQRRRSCHSLDWCINKLKQEKYNSDNNNPS